MRVQGAAPPAALAKLLDDAARRGEPTVLSHKLLVSLFDADQPSFFGRTWEGPEQAVQPRQLRSSSLDIEHGTDLFMHTRLHGNPNPNPDPDPNPNPNPDPNPSALALARSLSLRPTLTTGPRCRAIVENVFVLRHAGRTTEHAGGWSMLRLFERPDALRDLQSDRRGAGAWLTLTPTHF